MRVIIVTGFTNGIFFSFLRAEFENMECEYKSAR